MSLSEWHTTPVTLRSRHSVPSFESSGLVPYPNCPLAVTNSAHLDHAKRKWVVDAKRWTITHRATGYELGSVMWSTVEEAQAWRAGLRGVAPVNWS